MKLYIKPTIIALTAAFAFGLCFAQAPLTRPEKKKDKTEQKANPSVKQSAKPKKAVASQPDGYIGSYGYVDLGLPSGLKWATCNVGAITPEGYGDYFAWGETKPKTSYTEENSATYKKDNSWLHSNGYIDSSGNLTMAHDVARQNWGGSWRMPTKSEIQELKDNTTTQWTTFNGVNGRLVTSKRNGKSIFLPAAGSRYGTSLGNAGDIGLYWSAAPRESDSVRAYDLIFFSGNFGWDWDNRRGGRSVRPVAE